MALHLTSMKSTKGETLLGGEATSPDKPEYPYGLRISLDDETLGKLGIKELPATGTKMHIVALVEVVDRSEREDKEGVNRSLGLQITEMEIKSESPEKSAEEKLFGPSRPEPRGPQITDIGDF